MTDTRNFIAGLITEINTATDPESVTNQMVARVMQYFLEKLEEQITTGQITDRAVTAVKIALGAITGSHMAPGTITMRELAPELLRRLGNLEDAIDTMTGDNATEAIERFQEVIAFLEGVTDDNTLTGLLNGLREDIEGLQGDIEELRGRKKTIFIDEFTDEEPPVTSEGERYYNTTSKKLYLSQYDDSEYPDLEWAEETPASGVLYIDKTANVSYIWKNGDMRPIKPGDNTVSEEKLTETLRQKLNAKEVIVTGFWGVWPIRRQMVVPAKAGLYMYFTDSQTLTESVDINGRFEWVEKDLEENVIYVDGTKNIPYIWDGTDMVAIAPEKVPASIFNATAEAPVNGFYTLIDQENTELSATHAAWNAGKAVLGLMISFKLSAKVVKTYQYIGATVTEQNWYNAENWQDFGSLATVVHHTETTASITPRDLHAWGGVQSLEISFVNGTPGCENEYKLEFTVSGNNFTLSLPAGVRWIEEPEWQDGWTYQVSILNNLAIYAGWEAAQS